MRRAALAIVAALLLLPGTAAAAPDTVVDFNAVPEGQEITNQYAPVGVNFGSPQSFGLPPSRTCRAFATFPGIDDVGAQISCFTGAPEQPDRFFGTAFEFDVERRRVQFNLSSRVNSQTEPINATVIAYGIGGDALEGQTVPLPPGANVHIDIDRTPTQEIVGIVITGELGQSQSGPVLLDDVVATLDDEPPPKKFSLALGTPSVEVVEGATAEAIVSVRRFNGSTGNVTLDVDSLPPGIVATQFDPNPVTGRDPVKLRITADRPLDEARQITVTASGSGAAGTGVVTELVQTVTGAPAVQIPAGGRFPIRLVPGCGPQDVADGFTVRGGFTDTVFWGVENPTGLLSATEKTIPLVSPTVDGFYPVTFVLDPGPADGGGGFDFAVDPTEGTPSFLRLSWITDRVSFHHVPSPIARPITTGSRTVSVVGNFPMRTCPMTFRDTSGLQWDVLRTEQADIDGSLRDVVTLDLPPGAASGPLSVLSPSGAVLARSERIEVLDYRNNFALSQANNGPGAVGTFNWEDFQRVFGRDETEDCYVFCVRDAMARKYYDRFRAQVTAGEGLCAGWAAMSLRFRGFNGVEQRPSEYQPGATRAFQIAPLGDGTAVKRDVVRWQVAQNDTFYVDQRLAALARGAEEERAILRELIGRYGAAPISLRQGNTGHAVVAYAIQDQPDGDVLLSVYDPNVPYTAAEETDTNLRTQVIGRSVIEIDPFGRWELKTSGWKGLNDTLGVVPFLPPADAALAQGSHILASIIASADGAAPAEVSGITADGVPQLGPDGASLPGSGVKLLPVESGAGPLPQYDLQQGKSYSFTVRGVTDGSYENGALGNGAGATVSGAQTAPGQIDRLVVQPASAELEFETGAASDPVSYELVDEAGRATRSASIAMTARRGAPDEASLSNGALSLRHDGPPTNATFTLGSTGEGLPGSVTTAPVRVGGGRTAELRPRRWSDLTDGIRLTVRDRRGRVVSRRNLALRKTTKVKLKRVRARRRGGRVTVTGRVVKRGTEPLLAGVVEVVRGGRVIRRHTATLRGAEVRTGPFSLPVQVGSVPGGARLRAVATLIDEGEDLASVRRKVRVR